MNSESIRQAFLDFFQERGHLQFPSMSLVPSDPSITTMFTIAGMQQMIPYFLGREEPPARRIVNVQRGLRTVDIEEVGDASHLTFLEMLGNFSVGDYFKREAVAFTWEFLTERMRIPADRWWVTIYPGDEEARTAWLAVGVAAERIGETAENWWDQGPVGPCGTDSEIHYDRGTEYGCGREDCRPENDCCERFVELWNNVFMVYFREESGDLRDLPWRNIDTGMGLERLVMIAQGAETIFDTDLFLPIIARVTDVAGVKYGTDGTADRSLRIIADHSRAVAMLIADRVMPAAEGRGYVLRRLIRRAILHGRTLGIKTPFFTQPVSTAIDSLSSFWGELGERRDIVLQVVAQEESRFLQTLARGLTIFEDVAAAAAASDRVVSGDDAFLLYDTHGFPLEITTELASERGLEVDRDGFDRALQAQRKRAKAGRKYTAGATSPDVYLGVAERTGPTDFTGYDEVTSASHIGAILAEGQPVERAEAGDEVDIVLNVTPFYAESGGQVGDTGLIRGDSGTVEVVDTQRPVAALIVHRGVVVDGSVNVGDAVVAEVDTPRRLHVLPHHSGTHLLHKALQEVLGPEATQAGSLVAPDRLRFDFRWPRPVSAEELREVQDRVNAAIWANLPVRRQVMAYDDAIAEGATALFGEKYGERVRVVSIGDWSKELCGGTHVNASGDIGLFVIVSESGIGSGVRRIEALAGAAAYAYVNDVREQLASVASALGVGVDAVVERSGHVLADLRRQEKRANALAQRLAEVEAERLVEAGIAVDGFTVVAGQIAADSSDYLKTATDAVRSRLERGIVVLGSVLDGKPLFTMAVTGNLHEDGFAANVILREAMQRTGAGGAGGSADFAQGGGGKDAAVPAVLQSAVEIIRNRAEQ